MGGDYSLFNILALKVEGMPWIPETTEISDKKKLKFQDCWVETGMGIATRK